MSPIRRSLVIGLAAVALIAPAAPPAAAQAAAPACDTPEHRAFDFWIGEWTVTGPGGRLAGANRIEKVHGGCALHESYSTPSGYSGESLNMYEASRRVWHQTWVDNGGPAPIEQLAWMQGCWETGSTEEQWMAPRGGSMLGMSRSVRDDRIVSYEYLMLREQDGRLAYEARPAGQPPAVFLSIEVGDNRVVFENPEHDFPQRIGYRLEGDSLAAWIEGTLNGEARRVDFPYTRARCSGAE